MISLSMNIEHYTQNIMPVSAAWRTIGSKVYTFYGYQINFDWTNMHLFQGDRLSVVYQPQNVDTFSLMKCK